jgi:site-specific DNA-methyltransferase (adenine-specific)
MRPNPDMLPSKSNDWETPQPLFDYLDSAYHFTLDACATPGNAKCKRFYTQEDDGLSKSWTGETVWINPPYSGRGTLEDWVKKAAAQTESHPSTIVVGLLPVRTSNAWFRDYVYRCAQLSYIIQRIRFGGADNVAPFPSMIAVWGCCAGLNGTITLDDVPGYRDWEKQLREGKRKS